MTEVDRLVAVFETLNEGHRRQVAWLAEELRHARLAFGDAVYEGLVAA